MQLITTIVHKKGKHFSNRWGLNLHFLSKRKTILYEGRFTHASYYPYIDDPKYPNSGNFWNKLGGISFNPLTNSNKNAVLIGWRVARNGTKDVSPLTFELSPYIHDTQGNVTNGDTQGIPTFRVKYDERFWIKIELYPEIETYKITFYSETQAPVSYITKQEVKHSKIFRTINPYFGGRPPAPNYITYYFRKIRKGDHQFIQRSINYYINEQLKNKNEKVK